jgi:hypothetical protein
MSWKTLGLMGAMPMPYLLLQIGLVGIWFVYFAFFLRQHGRRGFWFLITAPVLIVLWDTGVIIGFLIMCGISQVC